MNLTNTLAKPSIILVKPSILVNPTNILVDPLKYTGEGIQYTSETQYIGEPLECTGDKETFGILA